MERCATDRSAGDGEGDEECDMEASKDEVDNIPHCVIPGLYMGSIDAARNRSALQSRGIARTVRCCCDEDVCAAGYDPSDDPPGTLVLQWRGDLPAEELASGELETALDHLRQSIVSEAGAALVHSIAGRSRSAAVVLAWLVVSRGASPAEALRVVRGACP
eukprot:CAMPEP_0204594662 /NCGR_PEP_ID=MMETSP0661-20131031/52212_1 /ASSEMBLY_ACC=CAM_ASM_000606 /TAXON_ID=109239 /ORGANISM="Alexandrium margalefi, Strain AMGDE01CS-322" /LENGTH=160 /DNA_ID=CAMNT_0051605085 /DNA_START=26 /DNA_END=505 /DNA_ORIENTATION=+